MIKIQKEANWKNYLIKSEQFFESARDAYIKGNWNSVGLNSVHSAISANDSLTSHLKNIRSMSDKHSDSIVLLQEVFNHNNESIENSKHLQWLINRKNLIEYESRLFYQKEAEEALKHADRFFNWAKKKLPL